MNFEQKIKTIIYSESISKLIEIATKKYRIVKKIRTEIEIAEKKITEQTTEIIIN